MPYATRSDASSKLPSVTVQSVLPPAHHPPNVLLATAWVILRTEEGRAFKLRALLDQGSSFSFISESVSQLLHTRKNKTRIRVLCFGGQFSGIAKHFVNLRLESCYSKEPSLTFFAYVFQNITSYAISKTKPITAWPHLNDLTLADPTSNQTIHVLIGSDLYGSLLLNDIRKGPSNSPTAQLTVLGWILSGPVSSDNSSPPSTVVHNCTAEADVDDLLRRFWELEENPRRSILSDEDERCKRFFLQTHSRDSDGRYTVRLPFKNNPTFEKGESRALASRMLNRLENRLRQKPEVASLYHEFLTEYLALNYMEKVCDDPSGVCDSTYTPHHPVLRQTSRSTKLRVVFNASTKHKNGLSLNDHLMVGPKLQRDLASIILLWRQHRYVLTADVAKMFRQIRIHPEDTDFQRILWRPCPESPIEEYRLLTVTYGMAAAPYLAIRVIDQLVHDEGQSFPLAVPILKHSMYVDDVLFGADDATSLVLTRNQLTALMKRGGFTLHKWATNSTQFIAASATKTAQDKSDRPLHEDDSHKILGISWVHQGDVFCFKIDVVMSPECTKRSILSTIYKLYDPLGWVSPVIVTAKILIQELWLLKREWDDKLPPEVGRWREYCSELQ